MAAVLAPHPTHAPASARRTPLRLVDPADSRPARPRPAPASRPVSLPPRVRPTPATYWRRRFVLLLAVTSVALGAYVLVATPTAPAVDVALVTAADPAAPAAGAADVAAPAPDVYVVRAGDTVWSIASTLQPEGDVRELVDQLTERAGGSGLQAGQRIALDGIGR